MNEKKTNKQEREQEIKNLSQETLVKYRSLGGWLLAYLILLSIGLFRSLINIMVSIKEFSDLVSHPDIVGISDPEVAILKLQFTLMIVFLFLNLISLVTHIAFVFLRNFKFSILFYIGSCVFSIITLIISALMGVNVASTFIALFFEILCILVYFYLSLRVSVYFASADQYEKWYRRAPYLVTPPTDANEGEDTGNVVKNCDDLDCDSYNQQ